MRVLFTTCLFLLFSSCMCQDIPEEQLEDQLQSLAENTLEDPEDDSPLQSLHQLQRHPLNLNSADEEQLLQLPFVSPTQVRNLFVYRTVMGKLIHVNELQAVPGWEPALIRRLLPYITVAENEYNFARLYKRIKHIHSEVLLRMEQAIGNSDQYSDSGVNAFLGSAQHVLIRCQFQCSNLLQFGILAEKDAGEKWFMGAGFDFNSFHLFVRNVGVIKKFAVGDFQVNMGQGLIQWQGITRKKSANVLAINQQDELITPYRSAGEVKFHRGAAVMLGKKHFEWMAYASVRMLSANIAMDSLNHAYVTSISTSGYHRTIGEINDRNKLQQFSTGSSLAYVNMRGRIRVNWAAFHFSHPVQKRDDAYNLFSASGKQISNVSVDYSYTVSNLHWFGECAMDKKDHMAFLSGMLLSLHRDLDCTLLFRSISRAYSSMYANAFTENSAPNNETGMYSSVRWKMSNAVTCNAYADIYHFPWLRFGISAPSAGKDFLIQLNWQPNKRTELYFRWKTETKQDGDGNSNAVLPSIVFATRNNFRAQLNWDLDKSITLNERIETASFCAVGKKSDGFLLLNECRFHPPLKSLDCRARVLFFQTGSYDARIYAFEHDVQYGFSVPAFSGEGFHYAVNIHYDLNKIIMRKFHVKKKIGIWLNWSQTFFAGNVATQGGTAENPGKKIVRLQIIARS